MEWFEWAFIVPVVGWLVREIWSNISQNNFMRIQSENEHQYFRKRLIFEQKHDIYKELYKKIKRMAGILNDFNFFDDRTMTSNQQAVEHYYSERPNEYEELKIEEIKLSYDNNDLMKLKVNFYYYSHLAEKSYLEFKNYVAEQNYILTQEENTILFEMDAVRNELVGYINEAWYYIESGSSESINEARNHFSDEYRKRFEKLDQIIYRFSDTIRKEMFL